jgi:S-adenosylmethionine decarboxylase proenzyme
MEFYRCDARLLDDVATIRRIALGTAEAVAATVVGEAFHRFAPQGVSGTVVIAESHISVHTWPESLYVAVDIFTCGGLDPRPGLVYLYRELGSQTCRMQEIVRGLPEDVASEVLPSDVRVLSRESELLRFDGE